MEFNSNAFIHSFINAHLAMSMYLIWQRESTAKVSIKNTSPNVQRLQYIPEYNYNNNTYPVYWREELEGTRAYYSGTQKDFGWTFLFTEKISNLQYTVYFMQISLRSMYVLKKLNLQHIQVYHEKKTPLFT